MRIVKVAIVMIAGIAIAACDKHEVRVFDRDPSLPADLPFSSAVNVGGTIYLSGEIGRAPGGTEIVEGGVGAQTQQIFENYQRTLNRMDARLSDIVKCTVFLDDMSQYAAMNAAYSEYFPARAAPARSTLGADGLALGADVEIECIAIKDGSSR